MSLCKRIVLIATARILCGAAAASAGLYVRDYVPITGLGAYSAPSNLIGQNATNVDIIGETNAWTGSTGTTIMSVLAGGLTYPSNVALTARGGTFVIKHTQATEPSSGRTLVRTLTSMPTNGTFYMSMLLAFSNNALTGFGPNTWAGAGLTKTKVTATAYPPADGVMFGFERTASATNLMVRILNTNYPLLAWPVPGQTYFCVAKIDINAGGNETVSVALNPTTGAESYSQTVQAELLAGTNALGYLSMGGDYAVNNSTISFDEILVGSTYADVAGFVSSAPVFSGSATASGATGSIVLQTQLSTVDSSTALDAFWGLTNGFATASNWTYTASVSAAAPAGSLLTYAPTGLATNTFYAYGFRASNVTAAVWSGVNPDAFFTGEVRLDGGGVTTEYTRAPVTVTVHRASSDSALATNLTVNYTLGGDASSGVHYATLGRTVIIPTGASSADIVFTPQVSTDTVDRTATIVLAPGAYLTGSQTNASVVIQNYTFPAGTNVWLGSGNASVAANWSLNRVPSASDNILLDSDSLGAMNWDAGVNGLSATVASWTQTADYTGAVTIDTRRGGAFSMFTITGNAVLNGGSWTHPYGDTVDTIGLRCTVGTNLTTGTGFTFDGLGRGYKNQSGPSGSGSISQGIAHGGEGGLASSGPGTIYGDYRAPVWRGSSATFTIGGTNGGGGAFYLVVGGAFLHNGHITVTGTATASYPAHSGGSIFIQAATLTGSGELNAKAAPGATTSKRAGGGGGRIAIRLTDAGATFATFTNGFTGPVSAAGSVCGKYLSTENHLPGASGTVYVETPGDNAKGTLVLDDAGIASDPTRDTLGAAVITTGGTGDLSRLILRSAGRLALSSNTTLRLPAPACIESDGQAMNAIRLDDTGALIFTSTDTTLDASAYSILANGTSHYAGSIRVSSPRTLTVTGMFSVNGLTLDGVRVAPGTYAASSLGSRVAGAGSIQVLGFKFGTAVLVR